MHKRFNTTGTCIPEKHYMADITDKINRIAKMVEDEKYFTINRPRQYGKTTTLFLLERRLLANDYSVIRLSFEGIGDVVFEREAYFCQKFLALLAKNLYPPDNELSTSLKEESKKLNDIEMLSEAISEMIKKANRRVVLIIDEVDKSSNNQLFLSFLGMLRNKYLLMKEGRDLSFHSVILSGVHDVKTLKLKLRPDEESKYNSPWNIAADFDIDMSLDESEIASMLKGYGNERGIAMNIDAAAKKLRYFTSGYPFLVSRLCEIIDEKILPERNGKEWFYEDIETAVRIILKESNSNFDVLIKNLENNPELNDLVYDVIIEGTQRSFNLDNPHINHGYLYGILVKGDDDELKIHNRIYEQRLYDYMSSKQEKTSMVNYNFRDSFIDGGKLNVEKILLKFQEFMKEQYSGRDERFVEREGRLLFLAFIKPIINGSGFDFKEVQISEERRLDIVITFFREKHIIELKIWRGAAAHEKGKLQLKDYLDRAGVDKGYVVIFDFGKNKELEWKQDWILVDGKELFMVRV